jgi:hypothetical protein
VVVKILKKPMQSGPCKGCQKIKYRCRRMPMMADKDRKRKSLRAGTGKGKVWTPWQVLS